ncbi:metal ABC transporter substrate-binding protein [Paenibacillus hexagrammi]|uniref:Metal ABC transporter substrate-binding protein n=1 Tax=Paenibacillus hexagrammi TaxID=2908839 RepID=A0ABY3SNS1_9BACL|nr:metal ABC transporter substrate-binding protein [Paenibacillus sp. YPD9-1]UJF35462.1 metal ABC transporter substrate-binding protein [Paenibacillus sp. YPD9-1]
MKPFIVKILLFSAVSTIVLAGCSSSTSGSASKSSSTPAGTNAKKKLKVVTTFYPMYEFSKQVAGGHADVIALVPAGAEPHDWEPTAKDMTQIQDSDVFVYNGAGVEHWVEKALNSLHKDSSIVVEASKGIELMEGTAEEDEDVHEHGEDEKASIKPGMVMDPHVWLDPVLAQQEVLAIQAAFEKADPAHKEDYKHNATEYISKLQELDQLFRNTLADVKRKEFVTQHAAFAYLAKRYGLTQVPIAGLSPEEEPAASKMADIVQFAKDHQVQTIFFETLVDPKVAETVASEIGAKSAVLNPIEGLTDEDKKQNLDYIGIMKMNLNALKLALNE